MLQTIFMKQRLLYICPHLSTGGLPQYVLKQIKEFISEFEIEVIEINNTGGNQYIVQKTQIKELVKLHTLGSDKSEILGVIETFSPNIIHFQEIPEFNLSSLILDTIFDNKRSYNIVVTTHSSKTNPNDIIYHPDRYVLVNEWSKNIFEKTGVECTVWEYPIEDIKFNKITAKAELGFESDWKHILMVGLFTPGKNQSEIFDVARLMEKWKIKFHFVGNQAINFQSYWKPLMDSKPSNCIIWGERNDVDKFYKAADLFYFSSILELNPLSIREALSYGLPSIFRKLPSYLDTYDTNPLVTYIDDNLYTTKNLIFERLKPEFNEIVGWFSYEKLYTDIVNRLEPDSNIVEVGAWFGKSTNFLAKKIKESGKVINLTAIDTFKGSSSESIHTDIVKVFDNDIYSEFIDSTILLENSDIINVIKDTSVNAKDLFQNNSLDFVMLDAGHTYEDVKSDIHSWFYKVRPGGVISGDDFITNFDGVIHAVREYFYNQVEHTNTVWFKKRPKIQILHLLTGPDDTREIISSKSIKQLELYGFDYKPMVNEIYTDIPPVEFCRRPNAISNDVLYGDNTGIGNITSRHYGCYLAHRDALMAIDVDNYDYTLIFEADAFIYSSLRDFVDIVHKASFISERDNIPYISFGNNPSWNRWKVDSNFMRTDYNQDWAHSYLIPNREKGWYMDRINDCEWDAADLWYNHMFYHHRRLRYTTTYPHSKQTSGVSLLDNTYKSWK